MNYIVISNTEIAKERVKIRVLKGGHGISEEAIERRYYESLNNLIELLEVCDEINIYDNTNKFIHIAYLNNGVLQWKRDNIPACIKDILE